MASRLVGLIVCALWLASSAVAAQPPKALVVLAASQSENADERSLVDHLNATMIRNATRSRYATATFLVDEVAQKSVLFYTIARLATLGFVVDVMVLGGDGADTINLRSGAITPQELEAGLKPLRTVRPGSLRFVYTSSGSRLAPIWREAGAAAVLSYSGDVPPFFFPRFIKHWGEGYSVTSAAEKATDFSSSQVGAFSRYVTEATLGAHRGVLASAPVFDGEDLTVSGSAVSQARVLNSVQWPVAALRRASFAHTPLEEGLLRVVARLLTADLELKPELIPDLRTLVEHLGPPAFSAMQGVFPGRGENEILLPGSDVRVILARFVPELDKYMQELVDRLDSIAVTRGKGKMLVDVWLLSDSVRFSLRDVKKSKSGQPYAVDLTRHLHLEISMKRDSVTLDKIRGLTIQIKLPVVPDGVTPRKVRLDTSNETLTISAGAIKGLIEVVARADVRARKLNGVDWLATILKNAPLLLGLLFFGAT